MLSDWWKNARGKRGGSPESDPNAPPTLPAELSNPHLSRPIVFDPALKQHVRAHRAGEPSFESEAEAAGWRDGRARVLHHVLKTVHDSPWREHLILRGSALMGTWFGDRARPPGDLDWVVTPASWKPHADSSRQLLDGLIARLEGSTLTGGITIPAGSHVTEDIWLYEKAPGLRVILPWVHPDVRRGGTVQMDFVFGEPMPTPPQLTDVRLGDLPPVSLPAATPEQSLAWKLVWLATDCYAAGKDLYDAVLLAERFLPTAAVVSASFPALSDPADRNFGALSPQSIMDWHVEWDEFVKEYPFVLGPPSEWKLRLARALRPMFAEL